MANITRREIKLAKNTIKSKIRSAKVTKLRLKRLNNIPITDGEIALKLEETEKRYKANKVEIGAMKTELKIRRGKRLTGKDVRFLKKRFKLAKANFKSQKFVMKSDIKLLRKNKAELKALSGSVKHAAGIRIMQKSAARHRFRRFGGGVIGVAKNTASGFIGKVDPLAKGINKGDISDTGAESIRLARQSVSKITGAIKTTKRTFGTAKRTLKITKAIAVNTKKFAVGAVKFTGKFIYTTVKITLQVASHLIAVAINPIAWIIAGILLVTYMMMSAFVVIMGGVG